MISKNSIQSRPSSSDMSFCSAVPFVLKLILSLLTEHPGAILGQLPFLGFWSLYPNCWAALKHSSASAISFSVLSQPFPIPYVFASYLSSSARNNRYVATVDYYNQHMNTTLSFLLLLFNATEEYFTLRWWIVAESKCSIQRS